MVDIIGPHKIIRKVQNDYLILKYLTVINPATGSFKIVKCNDKNAATIYKLVEEAWICRYISPTIIIYY